MQARVEVNGDVSIIHLSGYLDFETTQFFESTCLSGISTANVIFDFSELNFVGSSGLTPFLESIRSFADKTSTPIRFSGVGIEFRRLMMIGELSGYAFFDRAGDALQAIHEPLGLSEAVEGPSIGYQISDDWISGSGESEN